MIGYKLDDPGNFELIHGNNKRFFSSPEDGRKIPCTLRWPYSECTWLYCDYFIWCVSCTVVVLTCFVMCGCVYVGVFW